MIALIPARAGSRRIPGKNMRRLAGHPLLAYTLAAAQQSGVFDRLVVSTDDPQAAALAVSAGADVHERRAEHATDDSPDIDWVRDVLRVYPEADAFAILRPTSPFRSASTIRTACASWMAQQPADSLRAVRFTTEHPGKMWVLATAGRMVPLLPHHFLCRDWAGPLVPWHSSPTQCLPVYVVQTAGLEIAWARTVHLRQSISGTAVLSYLTEGYESLDLNSEDDWTRAEALVASGAAVLPTLDLAGVSPDPAA